MLDDLEVAAALDVRERDDPLDARGRLACVSVEHHLELATGVRGERKELDPHRAACVVPAPHDAGLLEHPDEHARVVGAADGVVERFGQDDAACVPERPVHRSQELGGRDASEREPPQRRRVGVAGEEHGVARLPVATGPSDHLHVAFERVGEVDERDEADVRLVDAHAEGGRCDHNGRATGDEGLLHARPFRRLEARVVVLRADPVAPQRPRDLLAGAPRARVDDRHAVRHGAQPPEQAPKALLGVLGPLDVVAEVRPVDARPHELERTAERLRDRIGVRRRGRRRHAEHRGNAEVVERATDEEVVGPEVVAPHRDAVHLVDHDEPDADRPQRADERLLPQPLGRRVEDPRLAGGDGREPPGRLVRVERRVDEGRRRADPRRQLVDLVLHQCDERREDERRRGPQHRRELVRERLARAGRHHRERVDALDGGVDHCLLPRAEVVEAEELPERGAQVGHPNECTGAVGGPQRRLGAGSVTRA